LIKYILVILFFQFSKQIVWAKTKPSLPMTTGS